MFDLHVSGWSVSLSNHKVASRPVVPCHVEVPSSIVPEFDIGKVVCPVLNRIEVIVVLTSFKSRLRRSLGDGRNSSKDSHYNRCERQHRFYRPGLNAESFVLILSEVQEACHIIYFLVALANRMYI
jgi:hypothetical protein